MNVTFFLDGDEIGHDYNVPNGGTAIAIIDQLEVGTTYTWYVIADDGQDTTQSSTWEFTTEETGANNNPDLPIVTGPFLIIAGEIYDFTFKSFDIDGDDIKFFIDWQDGTTNETEFYNGVYPGTTIIISHMFYAIFPIFPGSITVYSEDEHGLQSDLTTFTFIIITSNVANQQMIQSYTPHAQVNTEKTIENTASTTQFY